MIIFTGAGTGGHVNTALSVISALYKRSPDVPVLFVGSINLQKGMWGKPSLDEVLVKRAKVRYEKIRSGKLQRFWEWRTLKLAAYIPVGFYDAFFLVKKYRPKIIIGFGGFTTPPLIFAGKLFGAKTFLHEQTTSMGLANRFAGRFVDKVLVSFPPEYVSYPSSLANKVKFTGYPLREVVFIDSFKKLISYTKSTQKLNQYSTEYLESLKNFSAIAKNKGKKVLLIMGGGLGSSALTNFVIQNLDKLLKDFVCIVQTGNNPLYEKLTGIIEKEKLSTDCIVVPYINDEIGYIYSISDIILSRSGAGTVYEIGVLKKKAILVPLPFSRGDEQLKNAMLLEKAGLGRILPQNMLNYSNFKKAVRELKNIKCNNSFINQVFVKDAALNIANLLISEYNRL